MPGLVRTIAPQSAAFGAGVRPGDAIVAINGHVLRDVLDAQFYGADNDLIFTVDRDGRVFDARAARAFGQPLGIEFEHPTFDIDIRRCNNLCPFCFVLQNAPRMRRTLYIKDDDYRYSFMFGHFVTLTNLTDEDWARLAEQRLSPLYVSVHCTDLDIRRKCLRNPNAADVMAQLRWLAEHDIQAHTQLVITPDLNDGDWVEKSVRDLASLWPDVMSVTVVPVGLTKHHKYGYRPHTPAECAAMIERVEAWQAEFRRAFGVNFVYATDEWYLVADRPVPPKKSYDGFKLEENGLGMVRNFLNEWRRLKKTELAARDQVSSLKFQVRAATLATGTIFAPTLKKAAREFAQLTGVQLDVLPIANTRLGDTITVSGLLMGHDVIDQVRAADPHSPAPSLPRSSAPLLILPRLMFDHPDGIAMDDLTPHDVARALHRPVALADWMGDVLDALTGANKLTFLPTAHASDVPIVREGGWAVEKYL